MPRIVKTVNVVVCLVVEDILYVCGFVLSKYFYDKWESISTQRLLCYDIALYMKANRILGFFRTFDIVA